MNDDIYKTGAPTFDKIFEFLTGDIGWEDHGGKWFRQVSPSRFHVVEIFNWEEATGEEEMGYNVCLNEVDTDDADRVRLSLDSRGYALDDDGTVYVPYSGDVLCEADDEKSRRLIFCECMDGYGASAPLENLNGEDFVALFEEIAALSNSLVEDEDAYEERMNRPVNALGSTAREYQHGDFDSALMRGLAREDARAQIMAKMQYGPDSVAPLTELAHLMQEESE